MKAEEKDMPKGVRGSYEEVIRRRATEAEDGKWALEAAKVARTTQGASPARLDIVARLLASPRAGKGATAAEAGAEGEGSGEMKSRNRV